MIYDCILAIGCLIFLPKVLKRKLRQRFGRDIPPLRNAIWIHAVSVGEVKSAKGLVEKLKVDGFSILVTTGTATGQEEAKRSLRADAYAFLPLDFSWIMRRWVRTLKPQALIFVESDFWYNLLKEAKKAGVKTVLVSGKLSPKSARRFKLLRPLASKLFSLFDTILVQTELHQSRFAPFAKTQIGGNLKLDAAPLPVDPKWASYFQGFNILISCTHAPEENDILDALESIEGTLYLAPRHPERYSEVAALLASKNIPFCRWSQFTPSRVILIDSMGLLPIFYTHCDLAIVAGSFSSRIGGHNILEPCLYGTPVLFGPHMHQQTELAHLILATGAGRQVALPNLAQAIRDYAQNPQSLREGARQVTAQCRGTLDKTYEYLRQLQNSFAR